MTWPKKDKPEEITKLADNTIRIANEAKMMTVPVGLAFMEAIKAKPDLEMYMPDKSHPSAAGPTFTVRFSIRRSSTARPPTSTTSANARSLFPPKRPSSCAMSPGAP